MQQLDFDYDPRSTIRPAAGTEPLDEDKVWKHVGDWIQEPRPTGKKYDNGKPPLTRLFSKFLLPAATSVVRVMEFGAQKYGWDNWFGLEDGVERYLNAATRHIAEHISGNVIDKESGLPTLGHAACSTLFALAIHLSEKV